MEVNSTWLYTSELANQRAWKILFTCVVYPKTWCALARAARMVRKSCGGQTHNSIKWNHSSCDFIRDSVPRGKLEDWSQSLFICYGARGDWVRAARWSCGNHGEADFEGPTAGPLGLLGLGKTSSSNEFDLLLVPFTVFSSFSQLSVLAWKEIYECEKK